MEFSIFLIALSLNFIFSILFQNFFLKKNFIDQINDRSSHNSLATRSGGVSMFIIVFLTSVYFYIVDSEVYDFSIIIPLSILFVIGLYDDIYKVDFKLKFIFQIIAAKILIDYGYIIDNFHGVFGLFELNRIFAQVFTIFIIVAIINAINFIDGIDGLATTIVGMFIIFYEFFSKSSSDFRVLSIILAGLFIPFLFFNFKKNKKIFLGDSGSMFLGGLVSIYVLNILSSNYLIRENYDLNKILFVVSILPYPILDITRVFFLRTLKGVSPFIADKKHIHHIILLKVKSHFKTFLIISVISFLFTFLIQLIF